MDSILQASLHHLDQRVGLSQLAQDLLHVVVTTLQLSATDHHPSLVHVGGSKWLGEGFREKENGHNTQGEDVYCDIVSRLVFQGLWGHVDGGSWSLGHGGRSQSRHDAGHAEVRYLGRHAGVQEDVSGGQVAVDDGRTVAVQEGEAVCHVQQDGALQAQGR